MATRFMNCSRSYIRLPQLKQSPLFTTYSSSTSVLYRTLSTSNYGDQSRNSKWSRDHERSQSPYGTYKWIGSLSACAAAGYLLYSYKRYSISAHAATLKLEPRTRIDSGDASVDYTPPCRLDLPIYKKEDLEKHRRNSKTIWVTFKTGVYDITEFVQSHPGGDKILLAAGGSLEPFWNLYTQHKNKEVIEILESLRIGSLDEKDVSRKGSTDSSDPYSLDPARHPALVVNSAKPFNAESPIELLSDSFKTPNELFFVRNHLPVPEVDAKTYRLSVKEESDGRSLHFSLDDLKSNFPEYSITSTVQCAGNRRSEMHAAKPVKGLGWKGTAISNAKWTGVRLRDVLLASGFNPSRDHSIKHVHFEGYDKDPIESIHYAASIPIHKALSPEVLLAYKMNDVELPRDHGFPLRVVVPGVVGARQVKWVKHITLSSQESSSHWQQKDYRSFMPSMDYDNVDYKSAPSIQDYPIQSMITVVDNGGVIENGQKSVELKGYAWSGGGRAIVRVEVSSNGGKSWHLAKMEQDSEQSSNDMWAWTLWSIDLPLSEHLKSGDTVELVCKAVDSSYNQQPEHPMSIWNMRGLLTNSWHKINVTIR